MSIDALQTVLILLGVVTVAYIVTHFVSDFLQKRYGFVTGVEYIVLGAIVGPGFGLLDQDTISHVSPAIVLGTGSLGLLTGLQMNIRRMLRYRPAASGAAGIISLSTILFVAGLPLAVAYYVWGLERVYEYVPHAIALGAVAMIADQGLVRTIVAFLHARGDAQQMLLRVARLCSSMAVLAFGIIFCVSKTESIIGWGEGHLQIGLLWYATHIVVGGVLGLLFVAFLVREFEEDKILTIILGMVIFCSGLAYYLELSPIVVNFTLGFVLANTSKQAERIEALILSIERPLYIVLFFFAGAMLSFGIPWWGWAVFVPYVALRQFGRGIGGVVAGRATAAGRDYPPMGLSLMAPGGLSVAMALDYLEVYESSEQAAIVYSTIILGVLVSEIFSYRYTRRWLIDATDVAPSYTRNEEEE